MWGDVDRQDVERRAGVEYVLGPHAHLAKWDRIWQPHSVLGPNLAAISCPVGPNVAARFGSRQNLAAGFGPRDKFWVGQFYTLLYKFICAARQVYRSQYTNISILITECHSLSLVPYLCYFDSLRLSVEITTSARSELIINARCASDACFQRK